MHVLWRGDTLQRLRLVSGLILFTFAATHFINHALGLISIDMMQVVQQWRWAITRSWPGTIVLLAALLTHASLGLYKLAGRATLRLPRWELVQILLGISIPFLLLPHIVNTRIAHVYFGVNDIYVYELARLWPASAIIQSLLLVIVWVHGCMGIHFWLRLYPPYRRVFPLLVTLAVIIPLAALGGFAVAGSNVAAAIEVPSVLANLKVLTRWPDATAGEMLVWLRNLARIEFGAVLAVVFGCIAWTYFARLAGPKVTVAYTARADRQGAARADAARDQPHVARTARFRLRRPGALLDLSRARRARLVFSALARVPRKRDARRHRGAAERAARLPDQA